jgi:hypothetical protein
LRETQTIGVDSVVSRRDGVLSSEMAGETVMMSVENGEYYATDPVASHIWQLLETPRTVAALCETLGRQFSADPGQIEQDTLAFLDELLARKLIQIVP